jgi:pimeloyl-ACP methyl ester carboxylesterase
MKLAIVLGLVVVALAVLAVMLVGWHFAKRILLPEAYELFPEFTILEVAADTVTLPAPQSRRQFANTRREGRYGLLWDGGYAELGEIISETESAVTRKLGPPIGAPPKAGDLARLETFIFRRNPLEDHQLPFETITLKGSAGRLVGWWLDNRTDKAIVLLHGRRRGDLPEVLRILPLLYGLGYSVLALAYRNHYQSDPSPDGFYHYGASEWEDAEAGLAFLAQQGVAEVALFGLSMGGLVALETYRKTTLTTPRVRAILLDSPLLDPRTVFLNGATDLGVPFPSLVTDVALLVARLRSGIRWRLLDQREYASSIGVPVLLIAGSGDTTIPITLIEDFAFRVPELIYHRLEGVEHVEAWNTNPAQYERWVKEFLTAHFA